jgi:peptide/nickel transport system permease protein
MTSSEIKGPRLNAMETIGFFDLDVPVDHGHQSVRGLLVVVANLAVDLIYFWLDPRIRLSSN